MVLIIIIAILSTLFAVSFLIIAERKLLAAIGRRKGLNVTGFLKTLQAFADDLKLLLKRIMYMRFNGILSLLASFINLAVVLTIGDFVLVFDVNYTVYFDFVNSLNDVLSGLTVGWWDLIDMIDLLGLSDPSDVKKYLSTFLTTTGDLINLIIFAYFITSVGIDFIFFRIFYAVRSYKRRFIIRSLCWMILELGTGEPEFVIVLGNNRSRTPYFFSQYRVFRLWHCRIIVIFRL